jgi:hypothetical protein
MPTFTTSFTPPPPVSGLTLEADIEASAVKLTWDASGVAQVDFGGFRVYRSRDGGASFELLALLPLVDDVAYDDYAAPLNVPLTYRLTQSNLDFESDPVEASTELDSTAWHIVVPGDLSLTFPLTKLRGADLTARKVQDVFEPIGRPGKLVIGDVVQAEDGELSFLVMPDEPGKLELVRRVQARMEGGVTLKATDGSVWEVQYGDMKRTFTAAGVQELSLTFVGVG